MSEDKHGREFITHELDEAIAIQSMIVETSRRLAGSHPDVQSRRLIKAITREAEGWLHELERLGRPYGATGRVEEVAAGLGELARETTEKAGRSDSEAYEAHAVLLAMQRKQQDSTAAILKIARGLRETEMRDTAVAMLRDTKRRARELADALATFALAIASEPAGKKPSRT